MELLFDLYYQLTSPLAGIYVQEGNLLSQGDVNWFKSTSADSKYLIWILVIMALIIFGFVYGIHRYNKWKKFKLFEDEMKSLDLNPDDESAFSGMVKRFELEEPVNILMSARLFDEMATKEIEKVLGSAGSKSAKEKFIETIYRIRTRTYHADWLQQKEQPAPAGTLSLTSEPEEEVAVVT